MYQLKGGAGVTRKERIMNVCYKVVIKFNVFNKTYYVGLLLK